MKMLLSLPQRIVLATHYYATGPAFELEAYLRSRTDGLLFVAHPLFTADRVSYLRQYKSGELSKSRSYPRGRNPGRFFSDVFLTVRWIERSRDSFDVFIAGDSLVAIAGLWLRSRQRVRKVILYSIDFVPKRFPNRLLNDVYHRTDAFASARADMVWNVSSAIEIARRERDGKVSKAPQLVVPLGANFRQINRVPLDRAKTHRIVFLGHILEKQGLQLLVEAFPAIRAAVPDATALVIGDGPYRATLLEQVRRLGLASAFEFTGFVSDHSYIERLIAESAIAVAPYTPDENSFSRFADPGKVKTYLACGLPVVMTGVPTIARVVEAEGAGRVVPYSADALAHAVIGYLTNPSALTAARVAAADLGAMFDWEHIFDDAFGASAGALR